MRLKMLWHGLKGPIAEMNARWGKPARFFLRWGVPALLLVLVGYSLTHVGWTKIVNARPSSLAFYLMLLVPFFVQPIADLLLYRNLLGVGQDLPLMVFLRKRCMNSVMLDYSGEVYFFLWARKNLKVKDSFLLHAVKDSSVLSASAGLVVLWFMFLVLLFGGVINIPALQSMSGTAAALGSLPLVFALALFVGNRKLTALSRSAILTTFGIHLGRCVAVLWCEYLIWWFSGALPTSADCLKFIALRLLVTRLPLVPNKDLLFVGVGVAAAGLLQVSAPKVAAVLVFMMVVDRLQDLIVVGFPWLFGQLPLRGKADSLAP